MRKPTIVTVGIHKGGVGKTTTVINAADALGRRGYKCLVIDADPQCNTTTTLMRNISLREDINLVKILEAPAREAKLSAVISSTRNDNVKIIPNVTRCFVWERSAANTPDSIMGLLRLIRDDEALNDYDYILIDTPPNIGIMVQNSLMITDFVIIPIPTSDQFALDGFATYVELLDKVRHQNVNIKILGVLLTKHDKRVKAFKQNKESYETYFTNIGIPVFKTSIGINADITKAHTKRMSVFEYNTTRPGAKDYYAFADELVEIINSRLKPLKMAQNE